MGFNPDNINRLRPRIGEYDGKALLRWDPVTLCHEGCVIFEDCPYLKKIGHKCGLEVTYMNTVYGNIVNPDLSKGIADLLSDIELQRVGLHLMPLYQQLIRLKKEAYAVRRLVIADRKGGMKVHLIFGEIRAVIRDIGREMKELGIEDKWRKKFGRDKMVGGSGPSVEELLRNGDPNYYDEISK